MSSHNWNKSICVFAGSAPGNNPQFQEAAIDVGKHLAVESIRLVYGGGMRGLMGFSAVGYLTVASPSSQLYSVIPKALAEYDRPDTKDVLNTTETDLIEIMRNPVPTESATSSKARHVIHIVKTVEERKRIMATTTDLGFVALPGGFGTLDEVAEMISWTQLALHSLPVVLLNIDNFYTPLMAWIDVAISASFIPPAHREFVILVNPEDAEASGGWGAASVKAMEDWHSKGDTEKFEVSWS